jgi:hypothetical protein
MTRFYDIAGWLCSSLGVALLVTSLVLVPENRVLGEFVAQEKCPGDVCNNTCKTNDCFDNRGCYGSNCQCNKSGVEGCQHCECKVGRTECYCGDK